MKHLRLILLILCICIFCQPQYVSAEETQSLVSNMHSIESTLVRAELYDTIQTVESLLMDYLNTSNLQTKETQSTTNSTTSTEKTNPTKPTKEVRQVYADRSDFYGVFYYQTHMLPMYCDRHYYDESYDAGFILPIHRKAGWYFCCGDHVHHGFSYIKSINVGATATLVYKDGTSIAMNAVYVDPNATNTGDDLISAGKNLASYGFDLVMYTCNGNWQNVYLIGWKTTPSIRDIHEWKVLYENKCAGQIIHECKYCYEEYIEELPVEHNFVIVKETDTYIQYGCTECNTKYKVEKETTSIENETSTESSTTQPTEESTISETSTELITTEEQPTEPIVDESTTEENSTTEQSDEETSTSNVEP